LSYTGECNGCGKCCTGDIFDPATGKFTTYYCENLVVAGPIGTPQATLCSVHNNRTLGMKVTYYTADGAGGYEGRCLSTYPREQDAIPPECSYSWQGSDKQPRWSIGYAPSLGNLISEIY